jgi:protein SCO1/2
MRSRSATAPRNTTRALALLTALMLVTALAGCGSGGSSSSSSSGASSSQGTSSSGFDGAAIPSGAPSRDFTLTDQDGRQVSLARLRGQVTVLAFLYSTCGGTCTVIAQQIRGALDELAHPPPVLFVSVDPAADTPAHVRRFLARVSLGGRARYLSGQRDQLQAIWRSYGIVPASAGRRAFERSASVLLLDRNGGERVIFQLEQLTPEALSHDVRKLL